MSDFTNQNLQEEIPIFFATDNEYLPFLDVALASLIENASNDYRYRIIVLNTGLDMEKVAKIKQREASNITIDFADISAQVEEIKSKFKDVYHFSVVCYYRLFIASLFPQYKKIVYLDCDLVVKGDIAELYHTDMGENILAATLEQFVQVTPPFQTYTKEAVGVEGSRYINSGVLVINLEEFRKCKIEEQFVDIITRYDFDLLDPDQAYLNYLCYNKILYLPNGWNKEPLPVACEGKKNIVHYALYKKPWQYDDVIDGDYFWHYVAHSYFAKEIAEKKAAFGEAERQAREAMAQEILTHAMEVVASENTFVKKLNQAEETTNGKISA